MYTYEISRLGETILGVPIGWRVRLYHDGAFIRSRGFHSVLTDRIATRNMERYVTHLQKVYRAEPA